MSPHELNQPAWAVHLVEVELTTKTLSRYKLIHNHHGQRLAADGVTRVVYLCTPEVAGAVSREADKFNFREQRDRLVTLPVFNAQGKWVGSDSELWDSSGSS